MKFACFGELMLRLSPAGTGVRLDAAGMLTMTPGGSEANTAVALAALGRYTIEFLTALPATPPGQNCIRRLKARGVTPVLFPSESQRTGLYWLEPGIGPRASEVYYDRMNSAFDRIKPEFVKRTSVDCDWFHSTGITPAVSERTCKALYDIVHQLPESVPFSLDLNYRKKLWNWCDDKGVRNVYETLCRRAYLVTGNENDFQTCLGLTGEGKSEEEVYTRIAEKTFKRFPNVKCLAVSLRCSKSATRNKWSGMLFVNSDGTVSRFKGLSVDIDAIVDRLGTGDAFTAGIIHGLNSFGEDYGRTVDFAVMLSALSHTVYGDFVSFSEKEVMNNLEKAGTGVIGR